jgi:hypothetical protein
MNSQVIPVAKAPRHVFDLEDGGTINLASGSVLPANVKGDTKLYVPAHDYWPSIPGALFVKTTVGEIRDIFRNVHNFSRVDLNNLISNVNAMAPYSDELFRGTIRGDPAAKEMYELFNTDLIIGICALKREFLVLPNLPRPNVAAVVFAIKK